MYISAFNKGITHIFVLDIIKRKIHENIDIMKRTIDENIRQ